MSTSLLPRLLALFGAGVVVAGCLLLEPVSELAPECPDGCAAIHAEASCRDGKCVLTCEPGFEDCNKNGVDGCEIAIATDPAGCGGCGKVCASIHGTGTCSGGTCTLACQSPFADCDGDPANGCESDTSSDNHHCGSCAHACEGACRSFCLPYLLTSNQPSPSELVVGATNVYWAHAPPGTIGQIPIHGGQPTAMATTTSDGEATSLALSPSDLYWFDSKLGTIFSAPLPLGGSARVVIQGQSVAGLAADAAGVFWSDSVSNEIRRLEGSKFVTVASSPTNGVGRVVLDATSVYFVGTIGHKVLKVPRTGDAPLPLFDATSFSTIDAIAVDAQNLYVALHNANGGAIHAVSKEGGAPSLLYLIEGTPNIVVDDSYIFFPVPTTGAIRRATKAGATGQENIATGQATPWGIAIDATSVYWTNRGDRSSPGSLMKIEKLR